MNRSKIKFIVDTLLGIHELSVPIDVEKLAGEIGAVIMREDFDDELSGFALQKQGSKYIGINSSESEQRQRFTIAHELGHLFLHKQRAVNYDQGVMMLRNSHSSDGTDIKEIEANRFAAELLMPEVSIRSDLAEFGGIDLISGDETSRDKAIDKLAARYNVSKQAMTVRLTTLYFN